MASNNKTDEKDVSDKTDATDQPDEVDVIDESSGRITPSPRVSGLTLGTKWTLDAEPALDTEWTLSSCSYCRRVASGGANHHVQVHINRDTLSSSSAHGC